VELSQVDIVNLHPRQGIGMKAMMVYVTIAEEIFESFLIGWYYDGANKTMLSKEHLTIIMLQCTTSIDMTT
jgi:hypothetical protein